MSALVIWAGSSQKPEDHKVRAEALATAYSTTAQNVFKKPKKVAGLKTLVFWGHGDPHAFCQLKSQEFVDLVAAWKKVNSGLDTVEMLTCNARHKQGNCPDSYTEQVLKKVTDKHAGIRFKAMPIMTTRGGEQSDWSVLKWHADSSTWAYIGAKDENFIFRAGALLEDFMPPRGTSIGYVRAFVAMERFIGLGVNDPYATKRK